METRAYSPDVSCLGQWFEQQRSLSSGSLMQRHVPVGKEPVLVSRTHVDASTSRRGRLAGGHMPQCLPVSFIAFRVVDEGSVISVTL